MLKPEDRILVFAPHPDDESLATGGLLALAFDRGLPVRVVYLTSGENNPWAQRLVETRWTIRDADRQRWGMLREQEAVQALRVLGGDHSCARFLRYPDQGLTQLLLSGNQAIASDLTNEIRSWDPTLILQPAADDAHPDHSALHVLLASEVFPTISSSPQTLNYVVHEPKTRRRQKPRVISLNPTLVKRKLKAILCHRSQLAASKKRFTSYARKVEQFFVEDPAAASFPPVGVPYIDGNFLSIPTEQCVVRAKPEKILFVLRTDAGEVKCLTFLLKRNSAKFELLDTATQTAIGSVEVHWNRRTAQIRLPKLARLHTAFLKVCSPTLFFDRAGWYSIPIYQRASKRGKGHNSEVPAQRQ
jgi:LmbE family N-acetylglucosaminyl deacetylase